jgi:N-acyl-D-aspartate/D-glutamate deacylase
MRLSRLSSAFLVAVGAVWFVARPAAQRPRFDVVIANGRIVDGTGAPWFRSDIGIVGDRITAIGALGGETAAARVDATDLIVAPGFIDLLGQSEFNVLVDGRAPSKILQGVTTEVTGEGSSIAPVNDRLIQEASANAKHFGVAQDWRTLADYFKRLDERSHTTINVATFVGAGGIRNYVIGKDDRPATAAELEQMKRLVAEAMEQGALASARRCSTSPTGSRRPTRSSSWRKSPRATAACTSRTSARRARGSSSRSTRCLPLPSARASPPRSGTSRPPTRPTSARCRRCCGASRRRAPAGWT